MKTLVLAAALVSGCINGKTSTPERPVQTSAVQATYLCVGMESSARFGACPGCKKDAESLSDLMADKFGYTGTTLISEKATKAAVVQKLKEGLASTPEDGLFLFFYSGHGGQEYLNGQEPDGADHPDEYLCLYDEHLLDDEIWKLVSTCRGRVFLYFDACHSATMYRSVSSERRIRLSDPNVAVALGASERDLVKTKGFAFHPERFVTGSALSAGKNAVRLLCWSGCKEAEFSYGGSGGGVLTRSVVGNWKPGCSYGTLWDSALRMVRVQQPRQNPVQTFVGGGFTTYTEAFK